MPVRAGARSGNKYESEVQILRRWRGHFVCTFHRLLGASTPATLQRWRREYTELDHQVKTLERARSIMSSIYIFPHDRTFFIAAPIRQVWNTTRSLTQLESWWAWLKDLRVSDDDLKEGTRFEFAVVTPLPYRLSIAATATEVVEPTLIRADITGDLKGPAEIELTPVTGGTEVALRWEVELMSRPLRFAALASKPLMVWGQDWAVRIAVSGARRNIEHAL
jgi:uncharacterized protein YndB with AHSA1/START domain